MKAKFDPVWSIFYTCPTCGASRGYRCITPGGRKKESPHDDRPFDINPPVLPALPQSDSSDVSGV